MGKKITFAFVLACILLISAVCSALEPDDPKLSMDYYWYKPTFHSSADVAASTLRNMGNTKQFVAWKGYFSNTFQVDVDLYGMRVRGVHNEVKTETRYVPVYGGSWIGGKYVPYNGGSTQVIQVPYQVEEAASVDFRNVRSVDVVYYGNLSRDNKWGAMIHHAGGGAVVFRTSSYELARQILDAVATLSVSAGSRLYTPTGIFLHNDLGENDKLRKQLKWTENTGAVVTGVFADSPAGLAGLRTNDIIIAANETPIQDCNHWRTFVQTTLGDRPEAKFELQVIRDGAQLPITLPVINFNEAKPQMQTPAQPAAPVAKRPVLGVDAVQLTAEEAKALGIAGGMRIASVTVDGLAAKSQMKPGDILVEINGKAILNTASMQQILSAESPQQFKVLRDGSAVTLMASQSF